jgi:hypothetical protein
MAGTAGAKRQEQHDEQDSYLGQLMHNFHFSPLASVMCAPNPCALQGIEQLQD